MPSFAFIDIPQSVTIIIRTVFIFLYAFVLLRLLGRRRLAHLTYIDILVIISFGSAVGDVMIYNESVVNFLSSLLAITVVAILVKFLDEFSSHSQRAQGLIEGRARLLVSNSNIIHHALAKENLSVENLMSLLRQKNVYTLKDVKKVFIEPDGELSIILKSARAANHGPSGKNSQNSH